MYPFGLEIMCVLVAFFRDCNKNSLCSFQHNPCFHEYEETTFAVTSAHLLLPHRNM